MRDRIFITEADFDKLTRLFLSRPWSGVDTERLSGLESELERAEVLAESQALPPDVVTMNSEVRVMDLDSGDIKLYKLVFAPVAGSEKALSVLAPIGTTLLG